MLRAPRRHGTAAARCSPATAVASVAGFAAARRFVRACRGVIFRAAFPLRASDMSNRTGRIIIALLGVASIAVGLSLLVGVRTLESPAASYMIGFSGVLCGTLLLRISLGVRRKRRA
jgi:uncharacterized membrane protein HdeD (DUF308 family)